MTEISLNFLSLQKKKKIFFYSKELLLDPMYNTNSILVIESVQLKKT